MSSVEIVSALERRLNASIPQQAVRGEVAARLKNIGRTAKIAGFRPGKIPAKVVAQHYAAKTQQEVLGEFFHNSFVEAVQQNQLNVMGYPKFELKSENEELIEFSAIFEVYPEVVMGELSGEVIERVVYELTPEDLDNTILTLRKQRTTYQPVERAASAEDRVCIDFTGKLDGEVFQGGEAKEYTFVLSAGRMLPEFEVAIIGMQAGEIKSFDMTFPENYPGMGGKQVNFTITLHKVEAPKLPEVDAAFAESVGIPGGDVSLLKDEIQANLQREMGRRLKLRNKEIAMNALLKAARFGVSGSMVENEAQKLLEKFKQDLQSRGLKIENSGLTPEKLYANAEGRVKLGLIIAYLAQKHDLRAKPEQVRAMVEEHAESFDNPEEVVDWFYKDASQLQDVENMVMEENVVTWTMQQATTTDKSIAFNELMRN